MKIPAFFHAPAPITASQRFNRKRADETAKRYSRDMRSFLKSCTFARYYPEGFRMKHMLALLMLSVAMASHASRTAETQAAKAAPSTPVAAAKCGDFLSRISRRPEHLKFIACKDDASGQLHVMTAAYKVNGRFASRVEDFFVRQAGMQPLRFLCCVWETAPSGDARYGHFDSGYVFPGNNPSPYVVSMGSEETVTSQRANWGEIEWFYVEVTLYLEEP